MLSAIRAIVLVFGLAAPVSAQLNLAPVSYRDFSGGYVDNVDPVNLQANESPDMLNADIDDPLGSLKPRRGFARCGSIPSGNTPTALYEYSKSDGTRRLIASDNANIYSTPDCTTWTTITTGLSSAAQVHFKTIRDKLWIVNGSTWPMTWDGTTLTLLDGRASTPSSPTIPKCSYIEFWKERVWCGAPIGDPSAVAFSALTDTNGNDVDPSTGSLAWPAANVFQIDQNAGSRLYGVKAYRNRLYAFKDNGVWEIGFDSEFQNFVRKTYASSGSRYQTSITEVDGILFFTGRDGIYAFDGDNAVPISAKIENRFRALNQPLVSQNYKLWNAQADFTVGTLSSATATIEPGKVILNLRGAAFDNGDFETGSLSPFSCVVTAPDTCGVTSTPIDGYPIIQGTYSAYLKKDSGGGLSGVTTIYLFDTTGSTVATTTYGGGAQASTVTVNTTSYRGTVVTAHMIVNPAGARPLHLYTSTFTARNAFTFQVTEVNSGGSAGWLAIDNFKAQEYLSSGTWTSEIYNTVSVSTWGAFNAEHVSNSGTISYEVRVGSNTGAVETRPWVAIAPGGIISGTTDQIYVQVRATLNASADLANTPRLDLAQVSWNSGGANTQNIYAYGWRNALWVSASSATSTTNNLVLRRGRNRLDAWMPYSMQIGPMTTFNDSFYAAASTSPYIYRMDYGTNDNGAAISWHWTSKDENWNFPNNPKNLREINIDYRTNAACNIRAGFVENANTSYCVGNFPSPNALLAFGAGSRRLYFQGNPAYTYRMKVCDDTLDQSPTIIGVTPYATGIPRRGD